MSRNYKRMITRMTGIFKNQGIFGLPGLLLLLVLPAGLPGCKKQDAWLDVKPQLSAVVPQTLTDLQAVMDNYFEINQSFPTLGLTGIDNFSATYPAYNAFRDPVSRTGYTWAADIFQAGSSSDWDNVYKIIGDCNIVLEALAKLTVDSSNAGDYNRVRGTALFIRSFSFYGMALDFCAPYSAATAGTDPGIPIRSSSDENIKSIRASVQRTYDQMTADLKEAISLLPLNADFTMRPGQAAANALLAKVYLSMEDYPNAAVYANNALSINSNLLDFNSSTVSLANTYRFPAYPQYNPEIQFYAEGNGAGFDLIDPWINSVAIDSALYSSYDSNDLRATYFYVNLGTRILYAGAYTGSYTTFAGIANNEVLLIRAEAYARTGNTNGAMNDLNALLVNRYKTGSFVPLTAVDGDDALRKILNERRKELPFTGQLRWEDLRRLNKDVRFAKTLTRNLNGVVYTLTPGSPRYVYPFASDEIRLSGIQQNIR